MVFHPTLSRRRLMQGAGAAAMAAALPWNRARAADLVIGFIYVGPRDDYGYNQAHAEGAKVLKAMAGIKVVEEERVPETNAVAQTMESMINEDGATILFPTSFGYFDPYLLKAAAQYPKVQFRHCGGLWDKAKHPMNAGSYFGYIDECEYMAGITAGHATKTGKLGFVAAKPIPQVLRNINAFTMGARSVKPSITTRVIFTGDWSIPVREAEATNSMVDQGIDVVSCHVDSPKVVIETAEKRGAFTCGYHANQQPLAPKGFLTGSEWHWAKVYTDFATAALKGMPLANFVRGGLADGFVKLSDYGPAVPAAARTQAEAVKARMMARSFAIFAGPLKNNKGNTVIAAGKTYEQTDPWLESMNWLVEGVEGSTA